MIKLENISKVYRTKEIETLALDNINFEVKEGNLSLLWVHPAAGKALF